MQIRNLAIHLLKVSTPGLLPFIVRERLILSSEGLDHASENSNEIGLTI